MDGGCCCLQHKSLFVAVQTNKHCIQVVATHRWIQRLGVRTNASPCKIDPGLGSHPNERGHRWDWIEITYVPITMATKTNVVLWMCSCKNDDWSCYCPKKSASLCMQHIIKQHLWFAFNVNSADDAGEILWLKKESNGKWRGGGKCNCSFWFFSSAISRKEKNTHTYDLHLCFPFAILSFSASLLLSLSLFCAPTLLVHYVLGRSKHHYRWQVQTWKKDRCWLFWRDLLG